MSTAEAPKRGEARRGHPRKPLVGDDLVEADRVIETLEPLGATIHEPDPVDAARERGDRVARGDLSWCGEAAEARSEVECSSPVAARDGDGFAGVDPDPDSERQTRPVGRAAAKEPLQLDRRSQRVACRAEDAERLVSPQLEQFRRRAL